MAKRETTRTMSMRVAFCGMMAALGIVVMLLGGIIPVATYCTPLVAGALLMIVLLEYSSREGWLVWLVTAVVSLILGVDKEASFFYIFMGYYPLIKPRFEKIPSLMTRRLTKLGYFTLAIGAMYAFLCLVLRLDAVLAEMQTTGVVLNIVFFAALILCMMIYDRLLFLLAMRYAARKKIPSSGKNSHDQHTV